MYGISHLSLLFSRFIVFRKLDCNEIGMASFEFSLLEICYFLDDRGIRWPQAVTLWPAPLIEMLSFIMSTHVQVFVSFFSLLTASPFSKACRMATSTSCCPSLPSRKTVSSCRLRTMSWICSKWLLVRFRVEGFCLLEGQKGLRPQQGTTLPSLCQLS